MSEEGARSVEARALILATALSCLPVGGCGGGAVKMAVGTPIKYTRTYCFGDLRLEQRGKDLDWHDTMEKLSRRGESAPHIDTASGLALGSIVTTVVSAPAIIVGAYGMRGQIDMDQGVAAALLGTGIAASVASIVLCVSSEGKYVDAVDAYNQRLRGGATESEEDREYEEDDAD